MLRFIHFFLICLFCFQIKLANALQSDWSTGVEAKVRIISPLTNNDNLSEFYIGLEYQLLEFMIIKKQKLILPLIQILII